MKKIIASLLVLFSFVIASAQTVQHRIAKAKKSAQSKKVAIKKAVQQKKTEDVSTTYSLSNSSSNTAKTTGLYIADPTIINLNTKANGGAINMRRSPIAGMPKRYYGFANGHLFFKNSDATSTGANTGSGSVGTGTSIGPMGTSGQSLGVNGKSPYAAPEIYGIPGSRLPQTTANGGRRQ
jgi:hypothetical protein